MKILSPFSGFLVRGYIGLLGISFVATPLWGQDQRANDNLRGQLKATLNQALQDNELRVSDHQETVESLLDLEALSEVRDYIKTANTGDRETWLATLLIKHKHEELDPDSVAKLLQSGRPKDLDTALLLSERGDSRGLPFLIRILKNSQEASPNLSRTLEKIGPAQELLDYIQAAIGNAPNVFVLECAPYLIRNQRGQFAVPRLLQIINDHPGQYASFAAALNLFLIKEQRGVALGIISDFLHNTGNNKDGWRIAWAKTLLSSTFPGDKDIGLDIIKRMADDERSGFRLNAAFALLKDGDVRKSVPVILNSDPKIPSDADYLIVRSIGETLVESKQDPQIMGPDFEAELLKYAQENRVYSEIMLRLGKKDLLYKHVLSLFNDDQLAKSHPKMRYGLASVLAQILATK